MNLEEDIVQKDLSDLLLHFSKQTYSASSSDEKAARILDRCVDLFMKDYEISVLMNDNGELCGHYPQKIIIIESEICHEDSSSSRKSEKMNNVSQLRPLSVRARLARCRSRFVVPVISFDGKNICRSATISSLAEIYGRSGLNFLFSSPILPEDDDTAALEEESEWDLLHRSRIQDIQLLKTLRVKYIFDLMLENKKVKYGMRVTSSEKVDKENRYEDFCLCCIPYPGCEFFKVLKTKDYISEQAHFDWDQDYVDADLNLPREIESLVDCEWEQYQRWDLATLTQNYFLLLIKTILENNDGILVHCISGWDRTPLFIALLRLSLWADGVIHKSLNALEILYLTIAYDWLLFGHDLSDRMQRDEEVFFFCFHFLHYITDDLYSYAKFERFSNECEMFSSRKESERFDTASSTDYANGDCNSEARISPDEDEHVCVVNENFDETSSSSDTLTACHNPDVESHHQNGSTPLPVPTGNNSLRNNVQRSNSLNAGSWQIVSDSGSCCSTNGSYGGPSNVDKHDHTSSLSSCEEVNEESIRKTKLECVRGMFLKLYDDVFRDSQNPNNATLTKIFNHVTDKFKTPWGR
ncbi:myotubularin-related protein 14-like isoform X2 [Xenia sp. Carnegie-2017]|uniref:myotubularin-related protein 14-like isoform X2 n=1 Tax=Xenia sp. Carnegie-2017 TaxID=2897299 RepID=UPI001F03685E|nr:myotubularin-related protein 14-like isoform X2 [Xenia sp. Carnegie-2017]